MKVTDEVLGILRYATIKGDRLVLTGTLDRKLYVAVNKVLEAAGGKWDRKVGAHVFPDDIESTLEQILMTGEVTAPKDFDYFPTPPEIVKQLIDMADVHQGMRVLEPSAGVGNIAVELRKITPLTYCVELLPENMKQLQKHNFGGKAKCADFLELKPKPVFDRVVMNPPFGRQQDIRHVRHAFYFLKPGGRLVSVMSQSVMFRENALTNDFRGFVYVNDGKFTELPDGAFKVSGTMVRTVIATIPN